MATLTIYWDEQDTADEGWAYRIERGDVGDADSGGLDGLDDLLRVLTEAERIDATYHMQTRDGAVREGLEELTAVVGVLATRRAYLDAAEDCAESGDMDAARIYRDAADHDLTDRAASDMMAAALVEQAERDADA